jgi:hypothetical protein
MTEHPDYFYADEPSFVLRALRHLSSHPDPDVSRFATEALSNPYSPVVRSVGERLKSLGHPLGELYNWSGVAKGTYLDREVMSRLYDRHLFGDEPDPHKVVIGGVDEYFRVGNPGDTRDGELLSPLGHSLASEIKVHPDDLAKSLLRVQHHLTDRMVKNDPNLHENHGYDAAKSIERSSERRATGQSEVGSATRPLYHYSRQYAASLACRGKK